MIHAFYLIVIGLTLTCLGLFSHDSGQRPPAAAEVQAVKCPPVNAAEGKSTPKPEAKKPRETAGRKQPGPMEGNKLPESFRPGDLLHMIPGKESFDRRIVSQHTEIDFSQYRETQLIKEDADSIVYQYTGPDGHKMNRTTSKANGSVWYEEWDDKDGKVSRSYYENGFYDTFMDRTGNTFMYGAADDGRKTFSRKNATTGMVESIDYDSDGSVKGVYVYRSSEKPD